MDIVAAAPRAVLRPLQWLFSAPSFLFVAALTAMLLRHPDVSFYAIDRVFLGLLVVGVMGRQMILRRRLFSLEPATWPMLALTILALASVATQPVDHETWSLIASKFLVPFALFHLAMVVFTTEKSVGLFETFALIILAYLSFTAIAFLVGAKELIFPRFILDASIGYHADRARGPLLQAVANGVTLNLLGVLALHSVRRGRLHGIKAAILLASVPIAILATMTRAVWLSFAATVLVLVFRFSNRVFRRACLALIAVAAMGLAVAAGSPELRRALSDRLEESGPVEFRKAVYTAGWQMFRERPMTGWGINQMPSQLARHVSGYQQKVLYPHNTYLELLVEHGVLGLALYLWLMWELWRLRARPIPRAESSFLDHEFRALWPILLGIYWVNAAFVVMNYQFVNAFLFTIAGMLAGQSRRAEKPVGDSVDAAGVSFLQTAQAHGFQC